MKRVIVTGGTGVTGAALIRSLLQKDIKVTALVRQNTERIKYLPHHKNLQIIKCDLENLHCADEFLEKNFYDVFFHLGWDANASEGMPNHWNDMHLQNRNVGYALDAVELCHKIDCPLFIAIGSQAEYGHYDAPVTEESPINPESGYAIAKIGAYKMTKNMCQTYGIKHIWARLFSVYGPYDNANTLIGSSLFKLLKGEQPYYTAGKQIWNYLYSFDAAEALYLLMEHGRGGEVYCVANAESKYLKNYIAILHNRVNAKIVPQFGALPYAENQVMYMAADISKLQTDTGFYPRYSFEEGISAMHKWALEEIKQVGNYDAGN